MLHFQKTHFIAKQASSDKIIHEFQVSALFIDDLHWTESQNTNANRTSLQEWLSTEAPGELTGIPRDDHASDSTE
ncbi:MAG: hypothetical protein U5L00_15970 [Desulfovermiculus sp.]|nr:hypothetical protein [Desulfovermiculus sp.]